MLIDKELMDRVAEEAKVNPRLRQNFDLRTQAFEASFSKKDEKGWEKIYVAVDIHDTILRASYENEEKFDYFPLAKEALQLLTCREDVCLILWTSTYKDKVEMYRNKFAEDGIRFDYTNEN